MGQCVSTKAAAVGAHTRPMSRPFTHHCSKVNPSRYSIACTGYNRAANDSPTAASRLDRAPPSRRIASESTQRSRSIANVHSARQTLRKIHQVSIQIYPYAVTSCIKTKLINDSWSRLVSRVDNQICTLNFRFKRNNRVRSPRKREKPSRNQQKCTISGRNRWVPISIQLSLWSNTIMGRFLGSEPCWQ